MANLNITLSIDDTTAIGNTSKVVITLGETPLDYCGRRSKDATTDYISNIIQNDLFTEYTWDNVVIIDNR